MKSAQFHKQSSSCKNSDCPYAMSLTDLEQRLERQKNPFTKSEKYPSICSKLDEFIALSSGNPYYFLRSVQCIGEIKPCQLSEGDTKIKDFFKRDWEKYGYPDFIETLPLYLPDEFNQNQSKIIADFAAGCFREMINYANKIESDINTIKHRIGTDAGNRKLYVTGFIKTFIELCRPLEQAIFRDFLELYDNSSRKDEIVQAIGDTLRDNHAVYETTNEYPDGETSGEKLCYIHNFVAYVYKLEQKYFG